MEKIIKIDNKHIKFRSTGLTPVLYKRQFNRDYFADIYLMNDMGKVLSGEDKVTSDFNSDIFYNITWILAKGGNSDIPPLDEWLEGFNEFPLLEVIGQLNELMSSSMATVKKPMAQPKKKRKK